jgi:hypothetical protein
MQWGSNSPFEYTHKKLGDGVGVGRYCLCVHDKYKQCICSWPYVNNLIVVLLTSSCTNVSDTIFKVLYQMYIKKNEKGMIQTGY